MNFKNTPQTVISKKISDAIVFINQNVQQLGKNIYGHLYTAFLLSSVLSYVSLFYALPYLLNLSFFISSLFFSFVFGMNILIVFAVVIKMTLHMFSLLRMNKQTMERTLHSQNLMNSIYSRYS